MKAMTAAFAIALCAASFSTPAQAQLTTNLQFQTPLNYRFSVQPRSYVFARQHRHPGHHHRLRNTLPIRYGPAVVYRNGDIEIPQEEYVNPAPAPVAQPVIHRLGETGGCDRQQLNVPGSRGLSTVNVWRC